MHGRSALGWVLTSLVTTLLAGSATAYALDDPSINALAIDPQTPTTLYAAKSGAGVFKSADAGTTWALTGLHDIVVGHLAIAPGTDSTAATVYAATVESGLLKSTDGGSTWIPTGLNMPVRRVVVDPLVPSRVYAIVPSGLFMSTNSGDTWSPTSLMNYDYIWSSYFPASAAVGTLAIAPRTDPATPPTLYVGMLHTSADEGGDYVWGEVVKSTDGGSGWVGVGPTGDPWTGPWSGAPALAPAPASTTTSRRVYTSGSYDYQVCWITDDDAVGGCVHLSDPTATVSSIVVDPADPAIVYAATDVGVFKSTDAAATWIAVNNGLTDTLQAYAVMQAIGELVIDPATPATLYAATALGVFKTTNEAETWNPTDLVQHSLLSSVSLDPSSVIGGATSTGTVRLAIPAPVEGTVVALSTTVAGVTIPPSVVVPGGATSVTFGISTIAVTTLTTVVVSATSGDATRSASLSTYPPITIRHVSLRSFLTGGYSDTGSVMVTDGPLPPEGVTVSLASSNPAIASVPASVTIPAGTNYAFFTVSATAVATLTPVTITATFVTSASTAVTVTPAPTAVASISLPPSATGEYAYVSGEVSLNGAAPPGSMLMVRFSSSDASVARGSVDEAQVAWGEMGLRFSVITGLVSVPTAVTISASFNGTSKSTVLTVNPPFALTGVAVTPPSVVGTNAATGSVSLNAPAPAYGVDVAVLSSAPATASVPVSVTIPAGATTASFTISTSSVTMPTPVTISATYRGNTKFAVLTVNPVLPPDAIAPDTSIVSVVDGSGTPIAPGGATLSNAALIGFTGTDNVAIGGFECRLDGSGFTFCSTPFAAGPLAIGRHTFEVRAVDTSNNRDATPALYAWVVDSPPDTTITSATDKTGASVPNGGTIRSNAITFTFTGTDNSGVAGFECSLDGATFAACSNPTTYTSAGRGSHTFRVRAVDIGGFRDPTPSAFIWTR